MTFNSFSDRGRTLMVKFTCRRCGAERIDELAAHKDDDPESYGYLHHLKPPEGWDDLLLGGPVLCPECIKAFVKFMSNEKEDEK